MPADVKAIDLTRSLDYYRNLEDRVAVSTAPGPDGIVRRIEVRSIDGSPAYWGVLALSNPGDVFCRIRLVLIFSFEIPFRIFEADSPSGIN